MHRINKMLLNWEVFSTIHHLIQKWDIIISELVKIQENYVRLFSYEGDIITNAWQ